MEINPSLQSRIAWIVCVLMMALMCATAVLATTPEGPTSISQTASSGRTAHGVGGGEAEAGNVTQLIISGKTGTNTWQGYVGNVSGLITLDDVSNHSLYNWTTNSPNGEVYATYLPTVDWTSGNINCWNWSDPDTDYVGLGVLEGWDSSKNSAGWALTSPGKIGCSDTDNDCVNETFTYPGTHNSFYAGTKNITINSCPAVGLKDINNNAAFQEVLLYNNKTGGGANGDGIIYTALIKQNTLGYDGSTWDFQMIVGENGRNVSATTTPYYFYLELS
jgi:hypothetical protein